MKVFDKYSLYYDLLYQDKDYDIEVDYIHQLINQENKNAKSILNMGCGTGKHDLKLLEKGYNIVGFDLSKKMINEANLAKDKSQYKKSINFTEGDIRKFRVNSKFDIITSLFHVMSYQTTNDALNESFKTAKYHMKDNGIFIFDCWNGPGVISEKPERRIKEVSNSNYKIVRHAQPETYPNKNCVDVNYDAKLYNNNGELIDTIKETHSMRYFFKTEVDFFAKKNQLKIVNQFQWLNFNEPDFSSWTCVYILCHE
jgi:SAM-dependent methyltransferase